MAEPKTKPTAVDARAYLETVEPERRRREGFAMLELMEKVTGEPAVMWGPTMIGFGSVPYTNSSGTNNWFVVGFSPRKPTFTIYGIFSKYAPPDPLLDQLGPHTTGASCVYVKKLDDLDPAVLETLIRKYWQTPLAG